MLKYEKDYDQAVSLSREFNGLYPNSPLPKIALLKSVILADTTTIRNTQEQTGAIVQEFNTSENTFLKLNAELFELGLKLRLQGVEHVALDDIESVITIANKNPIICIDVLSLAYLLKALKLESLQERSDAKDAFKTSLNYTYWQEVEDAYDRFSTK